MEKMTTQEHDDRDIIAAGYKPQFKRSIGFFTSFAVSFSFMSVLMGVFSNYGYVLGKAGPLGLWTWVIVAIGQLLVALVFAEMAGRVPLTGALYNWNSKLSRPSVAVTVHWLTVFAYTIGGAGIVVAAIGPLQSFVGQTFTMSTIRWIAIGVFLTQLFINVYGLRLAGLINRWAVIAEVFAIIFFGLILIFSIILKGQVHPSILTVKTFGPLPYWESFLMCTLLGAWTIFGFETPSDLSEETINVKQVAPKSIISSVAASACLGLFFLIALTVSIPNLGIITSAADPISAIVSYHLGYISTQIFLLCVLLAMYATSLLAITLASRLLFAVARDKHFIAHKKFGKISAHGTPFYAASLAMLVEVFIFLTMYGLSALYASGVVLLFLAYLITVVNFGFGMKNLPPTNNFSLGKWHWPVVTLAALWLIGQICILTIPEEFHLTAMLAIAIVIFSGIQYSLNNFLTNKKITL